VNDGTYCQARTFLFKRPAFILKSAHTSIGVHNEHFLYHRRGGSYHLCCGLLWSARLNMEWKIRLAAAIATAPFRDGHSRTNRFFCPPRSPPTVIEKKSRRCRCGPSYLTRLVLTLSLPLMFQPSASIGCHELSLRFSALDRPDRTLAFFRHHPAWAPEPCLLPRAAMLRR
jgi:hypothetical protein